MGHHQLDTLDEQILQLIADNARIPFLFLKWPELVMYLEQLFINVFRNSLIWGY